MVRVAATLADYMEGSVDLPRSPTKAKALEAEANALPRAAKRKKK